MEMMPKRHWNWSLKMMIMLRAHGNLPSYYQGTSTMKHPYFAAALCLGLVSTDSAFARTGWSAPVNGTVSAVMMPDDDVMMEIKLPAAEFQAIGRAMRLSHDSCIIKSADTGTANSMILVCGRADSVSQ
jgi:hypothetical protein